MDTFVSNVDMFSRTLIRLYQMSVEHQRALVILNEESLILLDKKFFLGGKNAADYYPKLRTVCLGLLKLYSFQYFLR